MKKLVHISGAASPHMVKFIRPLREFFDAEFFFYEMPVSGRRGDWWRMDLGEHGHVVKSIFQWKHKLRLSFELLRRVKEFNPDVIMLGGFLEISNYLVYRWAKKHDKVVVVFSEAIRDNQKKRLKSFSFPWRVIRYLYRNVDYVMAVQEAAIAQFRDDFRFGGRVVAGNYPADIDSYFLHPVRQKRDGAYVLIFPNRLVDQYNPLFAVKVFGMVAQKFPAARLLLNAVGPLRTEVERLIEELGIKDSASFLDNLRCWEDLDRVYAGCDIMLLPAKFSTGNYTVTEGMASGMACIVSENVHTKSASQLKQEESGMVLPLDLQHWVDGVSWYIEHPDEFARIAGINRGLKKRISLAGTAKTYYELLG